MFEYKAVCTFIMYIGYLIKDVCVSKKFKSFSKMSRVPKCFKKYNYYIRDDQAILNLLLKLFSARENLYLNS